MRSRPSAPSSRVDSKRYMTPDSTVALAKVRQHLRDFLRERRRLRRDRAAQRADDAEHRSSIDAHHERAMRLGVHNDRIFAAAPAQPSMKARWTVAPTQEVRDLNVEGSDTCLDQRARDPARTGRGPRATFTSTKLPVSTAARPGDYSSTPASPILPISRNSARMARSRCSWVSGVCSSAAKNAARTVALRM